MTFNSFSFFLFLPAVYLVFYFTVDRWRWLVLLTASYGFYASFQAPYLLTVLLMVTGISYSCGLRIAAIKDEPIRKRWFWLGIFTCVAILAVMKYLPLPGTNTKSFFDLGPSLSSTFISIGVSYFTFQAISYLADIYLEIEKPEPHFGKFALYMAFFPKLLQGPIERAGNLLPQIRQSYHFDYNAMRTGLLLFAWGLFKKVVVADRLALYADQVYNNVHNYSGLSLLIGTYAYALQIYFDFSAYTDMARGTGKMFGLKLTENFNSPYLATSIADFWRRWHISFSSWILDYIFRPLQMRWRNRGQAGTTAALIVTFLISGLWHGVTWGFVIWGLLHGIFLASSLFYKPYQKRLYNLPVLKDLKQLMFWKIFATFHLVCFSWIFFRANSISDSLYIIVNIFNYTQIDTKALSYVSYDQALVLLVSIFVLIVVHFYKISNFTVINFLAKPVYVRWPVYILLGMSILWFGMIDNSAFVYFKF